ncbi:MAG: hydroxymethylbilane synthase [Acidimicrobiales bacterium]|nr:hydroxymethylbilane synthase [Acidimicrobiales bacterium]
MRIRLATRQSPLALWQANHVAALLQASYPDLEVVLVPASTTADERLDLTIAELGGKGAFATQIQAMVGAGLADAAVHSAKDLPSSTASGLALATVPRRGNPYDVLVGAALHDLASGATVRTGSARRRVQLQAIRPDIAFEELRGNIATRLTKIPEGGAIVMAAAAIERLGLTDPVAYPLDPSIMVPQVGQGALAVECRAEDTQTKTLLAEIEDRPSRLRVDVERQFLQELGGDCELPAGAFAELHADGAVTITGILADPSGDSLHRGSVTDQVASAPGRRLAVMLWEKLHG